MSPLLLLLLLQAHAQRMPVEAPPPDRLGVQGAGQGYLLFDVVFHEQLNKQRRALMFFLDLAIKTKRTLVLPRGRLLRRTDSYGGFDPKAEFVRMSELLNMSALEKLHPVMDLEDFLENGEKWVAQHTSMGSRGCQKNDEPVAFEFNGLAARAKKLTCEPHLAHQLPAMLNLKHVESIAFSQSVNQMHPSMAIQLRPWVRFEQGVYDEAAAFVAQTFGTEPFLAIHWRRTDFLMVRRSQPGVLQSAQDMVKHARTVMEQHGVKRVYLATDSNDESELAYVNAELQPARRGTPAGAEQSLRARAVHANVEIAICGMADYFLGTQTSSFTLAITEERQAVFGHAAGTGAEMGGTFWDFQRSTSIVSERSTRQADQRLAPMGFKDEL